MTSTKSIRNTRDLLESQVKNLESKIDILNGQLADVFRDEMEYRAADSQEDNAEKMVSQRQHIMKKIAFLQQEIEEKTKAVKKAK